MKHENLKKEQEPVMRLQEELNKTNKHAEILQENIDKLTMQYGKEIATLKAKLTQQDAEMAVKEEDTTLNIARSRLSLLRKKH